MNTYKISLSVWILLIIPCIGFAQINASFNAIPGSFDINSPNPVYALDINYDDIDTEKQIFHLFLPDTTATYPLVVFIHGGGFTGGSPDVVLSDPADVKYFLDRGFAYASFGYRLIASNQPDTEGVIKSLNDSKRALQFVRHHAKELKIDPERIALVGGSAGAGTSLWLGTRSDMADPNAEDPVLQESTRVCAVVANGSQATYDLYKWETQVYNDFDGQGTSFTLDSIEQLLGFDRASNFYGGLDSVYQIVEDPFFIQYREDVDMLFHMSSDDPPIFINSRSQAVHPRQDLFHHSFHGRAIQDAALAANIPEVLTDIPALDINTTNGESRNDFVIRHLNACALTTSTIQYLKAGKLKIYPNPANSQVTISLTEELLENVEIYSITGKLVRRIQDIQSNDVTIPVSSLSSGTYIISVRNKEGGNQIRKLIID